METSAAKPIPGDPGIVSEQAGTDADMSVNCCATASTSLAFRDVVPCSKISRKAAKNNIEEHKGTAT
ncbi:hypothetical protein NJB1604_44040 [Mycobacterium marinum]|nr:hypothetical protein NJB1604_44040 [Mycobacterium marinum]